MRRFAHELHLGVEAAAVSPLAARASFFQGGGVEMSKAIPFPDRIEAGRALGRRLTGYRSSHPLVLGLPRGGVPVAREVARALDAPMDIWIARKLGLPGNAEFGMGAVAEGGEVYVDAETVRRFDISANELREIVAEQRAEVEARAVRFRRGRPRPAVKGRTILLVDDGVATGGTARAALRALKHQGAGRLVLAVPVGARDSLGWLTEEADDVVSLLSIPDLGSVGAWYRDFAQVPDADVTRTLDEEQARREAAP